MNQLASKEILLNPILASAVAKAEFKVVPSSVLPIRFLDVLKDQLLDKQRKVFTSKGFFHKTNNFLPGKRNRYMFFYDDNRLYRLCELATGATFQLVVPKD